MIAAVCFWWQTETRVPIVQARLTGGCIRYNFVLSDIECCLTMILQRGVQTLADRSTGSVEDINLSLL
jgi:hypothetical protein